MCLAVAGVFALMHSDRRATASSCTPTPFRVRGQVVDPEGRPCEAANVVADVWVHRSEWPDANGETPRDHEGTDYVFQPSARCDDDGRFMLFLPSAGGFTLHAEPLQHQPSQAATVEVTRADVTQVRLQSGPPWHWIEGLILDPASRPMSGWHVFGNAVGSRVAPIQTLGRLLSDSSGRFQGPAFSLASDTLTVTTDGNGRFRLPVPDRGEFRMHAHRNGVVVDGPIAIAEEPVVSWQIEYWQQQGSVASAVATDAETGALLDDAQFTLVTKLDGATLWSRVGDDAPMRTWSRLTPGRMTCIVAAMGGDPATSHLAPTATEFFTPDREPKELVLQLRPWAFQRVVLRDSEGRPVAGHTIVANDPRGILQQAFYAEGTTDHRGMVTMRVPPGPVRYRAVDTRVVEGLTCYGGETADATVTSGENPPLVIRMQ